MSYKQQRCFLQKTHPPYIAKSNHVFNYIKLQLALFLLFLLWLCAHRHLFVPAHSQSTFPVKGGTAPVRFLQKGRLRCVCENPGSIRIETFLHNYGHLTLVAKMHTLKNKNHIFFPTKICTGSSFCTQ